MLQLLLAFVFALPVGAQFCQGPLSLQFHGEEKSVAITVKGHRTGILSFRPEDFTFSQLEQSLSDVAGRFFVSEGSPERQCLGQSFSNFADTPGGHEFTVNCKGRNLKSGQIHVELKDKLLPEKDSIDLQMLLRLEGTWPESQMRLTLQRSYLVGEKFIGGGVQPTIWFLNGFKLPIWSQEQGHFRRRQPYSWLMNLWLKGSAGDDTSSYLNLPQIISPTGYAEQVNTDSYAELDLRKKNRLSWEVWSKDLSIRYIFGCSIKSLYPSLSGGSFAQSQLPDWTQRGAIVALMGGQESVRNKQNLIRKAGAKIAGWWIQDWTGTRQALRMTRMLWNWDVDPQTYPNWKDLARDSKNQNEKLLGYLNPYLADLSSLAASRTDFYKEAASQQRLARDSRGRVIAIEKGGFDGYFVNFLDPGTRKWWIDKTSFQMRAAQFSGWMADFGEAYPVEQNFSLHNSYLASWRDVQDELIQNLAKSKKDVFVFMRGGSLASKPWRTHLWLGDQTVTWDAHDGLRSAVTALISASAMGLGSVHSDVGGYFGFRFWPLKVIRDSELLQRWLEFSAFTMILRTHLGSQPESFAQIYDSEDSLKNFAKWSQIFAALAPERAKLWQEYLASGIPPIRALFLEYPQWQAGWANHEVFMLGSDILIAPVLDANLKQQAVLLPPGYEWQHLWSKKVFSGGSVAQVLAPLGEPAVFFKRDRKDLAQTLSPWVKSK